MLIHYSVQLTKTEVEELHTILNKGSHLSQTLRVTYVLFNFDEGKHLHKVINEQISNVLKVGLRTIDSVLAIPVSLSCISSLSVAVLFMV